MREKDRKDSTSSEEQDEEDGTVVEIVKTTSTIKKVTTTEHGEEGSLIKNIFWVIDKSFSIVCMGILTLFAIDVKRDKEIYKKVFGWDKGGIYLFQSRNIKDERPKGDCEAWKEE